MSRLNSIPTVTEGVDKASRLLPIPPNSVLCAPMSPPPQYLPSISYDEQQLSPRVSYDSAMLVVGLLTRIIYQSCRRNQPTTSMLWKNTIKGVCKWRAILERYQWLQS